MGSAVTIGVDIGQKVDPTAIVVIEATWLAPPPIQPGALMVGTRRLTPRGNDLHGTADPAPASRHALPRGWGRDCWCGTRPHEF